MKGDTDVPTVDLLNDYIEAVYAECGDDLTPALLEVDEYNMEMVQQSIQRVMDLYDPTETMPFDPVDLQLAENRIMNYESAEYSIAEIAGACRWLDDVATVMNKQCL